MQIFGSFGNEKLMTQTGGAIYHRRIHEKPMYGGAIKSRSAMNLPEASMGPLMVQGDHGPVKFRSIAWRALKT